MRLTIHADGKAARQRGSPSLSIHEFNGHVFKDSIAVYLPYNLTSEEFLALLPEGTPSNPSQKPAYTFPALQRWLTRLLKELALQSTAGHPFRAYPYILKELDIESVDWFWRGRPNTEDKLGFMKVQARIETEKYVHEGERTAKADWLPGAVFLRGGSVAVLIIIQPDDAGEDERYVILTIQPRIAAGTLGFAEIPAGMLDGQSFKGAAAVEIEEEAKLKVRENDLINLSELALEEDSSDTLETAVYPSPGACDEYIPIFLCQKRLTRRHMNWLKDRASGLREEGEKIKIKVVPLNQVWKTAGRDAKALAALALYDNVKREGKLLSMPDDVEIEPEEVR